MLLTIPATIALAVAAGPIMTVLFEGGRFTAADAATSALVLSILVTGLPAYVIIKVLAPGFYARKDMKTPVVLTLVTLALGVAANFVWIDDVGIIILPLTTAAAAWLNALALYFLLARRGHFRIQSWLAARLGKGPLAPRLALEDLAEQPLRAQQQHDGADRGRSSCTLSPAGRPGHTGK